MSNSVILINCENVKAAQQRIQNSKFAFRIDAPSKFALELIPVLEELEASGLFRRSRLAKCLNDRGIVTYAGNRWGPVTVDRLMAQLADIIRMSSWGCAS